MTCFPKGLLVLGYALVNFSEFYAEFVYVQKQVIQFSPSYIFLNKNKLFYPKFSPQNAENRILGL